MTENQTPTSAFYVKQAGKPNKSVSALDLKSRNFKTVLAVMGLVAFLVLAMLGVVITQRQRQSGLVAPTAPESKPSADEGEQCQGIYQVLNCGDGIASCGVGGTNSRTYAQQKWVTITRNQTAPTLNGNTLTSSFKISGTPNLKVKVQVLRFACSATELITPPPPAGAPQCATKLGEPEIVEVIIPASGELNRDFTITLPDKTYKQTTQANQCGSYQLDVQPYQIIPSPENVYQCSGQNVDTEVIQQCNKWAYNFCNFNSTSSSANCPVVPVGYCGRSTAEPTATPTPTPGASATPTPTASPTPTPGSGGITQSTVSLIATLVCGTVEPYKQEVVNLTWSYTPASQDGRSINEVQLYRCQVAAGQTSCTPSALLKGNNNRDPAVIAPSSVSLADVNVEIGKKYVYKIVVKYRLGTQDKTMEQTTALISVINKNCASATPTPTGSTAATPTPTSSTAATPTPTLAAIACNAACTSDAQCQKTNAEHICADINGSKVCRLDSNRESTTCTPKVNTYACNSTCANTDQCKTANANYVCSASAGNKCRLAGYESQSNCQPPAYVAPTPLAGCNQSCTANSDCAYSNFICYSTNNNNVCRLDEYPNSTNCSPPAVVSNYVPPAQQQYIPIAQQYFEPQLTPSATTKGGVPIAQTQLALPEELPQTGPADWANWLKAGLVTLGLGVALLLLL